MLPRHEILVAGNSLAWGGGFLGFATISLVESSAGVMLFDTGHFINREALLTALRERDMTPGDIDHVFVSHLHFDHVNNVDLFRDSHVLVSRRDWEYAAERPSEEDLYVPWQIRELLGGHDLELLDGDTDLGGGLRAIALPGHTPGSMGVAYDAEFGTVVLAGDAVKTLAELIGGHPGGVDGRFPIGDTVAAAQESVERVRAMADRIVPGHFPELEKTANGFVLSTSQELTIVAR